MTVRTQDEVTGRSWTIAIVLSAGTMALGAGTVVLYARRGAPDPTVVWVFTMLMIWLLERLAGKPRQVVEMPSR